MGAVTAVKPIEQQQQRASRMTLASVTTGKVARPIRISVHAGDGCGKTTFGSQAPKPIFLDPEDRSGSLDVSRFPRPESWQDVLDAVRELTQKEHPYQTLVVDTVDWLEPLVFAKICADAKVSSIEDVGGGFGKGYTAAVDEWRVFLAALERLQRAKNMNVVLLAHAFIKKFQNPEGPDFERYVLKMNDKAAAIIREWCDGVYFAQYEQFANEDKRKRIRGVSTGSRFLHTQRTAAYDAKDTYGLPDALPFSWAEFEAAKQSGEALKAELLEAITANAKTLGAETEKRVEVAIARASGDVAKLKQLNDWVNSQTASKAGKEQ